MSGKSSNARLQEACDSGVTGYCSSNIWGVESHSVTFANGLIEEISEREQMLIIAAYKQGRGTRDE